MRVVIDLLVFYHSRAFRLSLNFAIFAGLLTAAPRHAKYGRNTRTVWQWIRYLNKSFCVRKHRKLMFVSGWLRRRGAARRRARAQARTGGAARATAGLHKHPQTWILYNRFYSQYSGLLWINFSRDFIHTLISCFWVFSLLTRLRSLCNLKPVVCKTYLCVEIIYMVQI